MALDLQFTITQSADCDTLTFTETTGDGTGGYGDAGNPVFGDVRNTRFELVLPDGSTRVMDKNYLPTAATDPNGTFDFNAADISFSQIPNGVFVINYKSYTTDITSGSLVQGTEYIVTGVGASITYDGNNYSEGEIFVATAEVNYTENTPAEVNILAASKECNFLLYCGVKECLKTLMLQRCGDCDCRDDFHEAMNELIIDFNSAIVAFNELNYKCANDTLIRLEKQCGGICNDCGC